MLLSKETVIDVNDVQSNIIGHMGYAAYKLWNVCKYEREHWKDLGLKQYPGWYYQKSAHKEDLWYKSLPSQTAQEICKQLDKGYKSFFRLKKTGGVENPKPPRFKQEPISVTYMQNGIKRISGSILRLSLPAQLKRHMKERYDIEENYLFIENELFNGFDHIKQIKCYMPENGRMRIIIVYEIDDVPVKEDNGKRLSIDLGVNNPFTVYDGTSGYSYILGRRYNEILHWYDKEIAHYQSIADAQQAAMGIKYPKSSKRVKALHLKKNRTVTDLTHKCTRWITDYCVSNDIRTVVIGDIKGIRKDNDHGDSNNQKLHYLPYAKIYSMLEYKLALKGIRLIKVNEAYSSQTPPSAPCVSKKYAVKSNRVRRGLYKDGDELYNADSVGAYNIMRIWTRKIKKPAVLPTHGLSNPVKVSV